LKIRLNNNGKGISGQVNLPGSKSVSNRVLIIKALSGLPFEINNLSDSDDTIFLERALSEYAHLDNVHIGHAGTDMRFLTAFFSMQPKTVILTGSDRLKERPVKDLVEVLKVLGADISYLEKEGYPPLRITGRELSGGEVEMDATISSQFVTALLLISPYFMEGLILSLSGELVSKPYIALTINVMKEFGAEVSWEQNQIRVFSKPYAYEKKTYYVEADWSSASYYYSMVALSEVNTSVTLMGLSENSSQADARCSALYRWFGVDTIFDKGKAIIKKTGQMKPGLLELNLVDCPDIAQTLVVTCIAMRCPFRFSGLQTLKIKETDRIKALQLEARKFGIELETSDNTIQWLKPTDIKNDECVVSTYHDHRMAMSFSPLSLEMEGLCIDDPDVVSKSYPLFWKHLNSIGISHELMGDSL
jgi:3-phosphoshikimate 1-carboxyvinyltransferase